MIDRLELGEITRAISMSRSEEAGLTDGVDLRKMIRFLYDQILVTGYSDLN
jgi:hypothetical protein